MKIIMCMKHYRVKKEIVTVPCEEPWHILELPDSALSAQGPAELVVSIRASFVQEHTVGSPEERLLDVIKLLIQADSEILYWGEPDMLWEVAQERGLPADVCNMLMPLDAVRLFKTLVSRCVTVYSGFSQYCAVSLRNSVMCVACVGSLA
jgi:hypothetical protein